MEDAWELVPLIERMHAGTLGVADLWAQNNEHRIFFPRAIMLGLASLTGWNLRFEMAASFALALASLGVLVHQARATWAALAQARPAWVVPVIAALLFSFAQWENFLRGWQLQIFLASASALGALALLAGRVVAWRLTGAVALAVISTLSFGSGALVWPTGAVVLALRAPGARARPLAIWLAAMVLSVGLYAIGFEAPARHGAASAAQPLETLFFFLVMLGAPLDPLRNVFVSGAVAVVGAVVLVRAGVRLARSAPVEARPQLAFWAAVVLLVAGTAALTALARTVMFGPAGGLLSRYVTLAVPLWVAVVVALGLEATTATGRARAVCASGVALVCLLGVATSLAQERVARIRVGALRQAAVALVADSPEVYAAVCFFAPPELTRARAMSLRRMRLTVFRAGAHPSGR